MVFNLIKIIELSYDDFLKKGEWDRANAIFKLFKCKISKLPRNDEKLDFEWLQKILEDEFKRWVGKVRYNERGGIWFYLCCKCVCFENDGYFDSIIQEEVYCAWCLYLYKIGNGKGKFKHLRLKKKHFEKLKFNLKGASNGIAEYFCVKMGDFICSRPKGHEESEMKTPVEFYAPNETFT